MTENNGSHEMTKVEAILRQLTVKAMSGDLKAVAEVMKLDRAFAVVADEDTPGSRDAAKDQMILQRLLSRMQGVIDEPATKENFDGNASH